MRRSLSRVSRAFQDTIRAKNSDFALLHLLPSKAMQTVRILSQIKHRSAIDQAVLIAVSGYVLVLQKFYDGCAN